MFRDCVRQNLAANSLTDQGKSKCGVNCCPDYTKRSIDGLVDGQHADGDASAWRPKADSFLGKSTSGSPLTCETRY